MDIGIREAAAGDLGDLVRLHGLFMDHHRDCDERFVLRPGVEQGWAGRISGAVEDPDSLVLVATAEGGVVGCAYTLIKSGDADFGPERIGFLCDVYVEPPLRRRGVARRFLAESRNWLYERGIRTIEAGWAVRADEAGSTWPGLGFVPLSSTGRLEF